MINKNNSSGMSIIIIISITIIIILLLIIITKTPTIIIYKHKMIKKTMQTEHKKMIKILNAFPLTNGKAKWHSTELAKFPLCFWDG